MNKLQVIAGGFVSFILAGCIGTRPVIPVDEYTYTEANQSASPIEAVSSVVIVNKATDGKTVGTPMGSDSFIAIVPATPTKETVEKDLRAYFSERLKTDASAPKSLRISIIKAESYWIHSATQKTPFLGAVIAFAGTDIILDLKVLLEIETNGKVTSSYLFDERITYSGNTNSPEKMRQSYRELIKKYRQELFGNLEENFTHRYL